MFDLDKKDYLIGGAVVAGFALIVIMRRHAASSGSSGAGMLSGPNYSTAGTVYVPTTSYDIHYMTNKGSITKTKNVSNGNTTTTYAPAPSTNTPAPGPSHSTPPVHHHPTPPPPKPKPKPKPKTKPATKAPSHPHYDGYALRILHGLKHEHYATPHGGWNPNSLVDNLKSHGLNATWASQQKLAKISGMTHYTGTAKQNEYLNAALTRNQL